MKLLTKVVSVTLLLVMIGSLGIGMTTHASAATTKLYATKGVIEWVYGPDQNGPVAYPPMPGNNGGDISHTAGTNGPVGHKISSGSNGTLPTNGIISANQHQNSVLPQTGMVVDSLQRSIQVLGLGLLLSAFLIILYRKNIHHRGVVVQ
ncbi:hypothetical protein [Periweissella cryptocerci]|uniref:hypothetical protein n=1 Tax=Periweissella cryptocerci TaxID=2506420 RepID=UPI0014043D0E|nr:hypothetical protein [Periweissella cryptocerci]